MVDKSPQGTNILLTKIEEAFKNFNLVTALTERQSDETRDQRPPLQEGQFHVPSIIGENVDFGEGKWIPIYPFFSDRESQEREAMGTVTSRPIMRSSSPMPGPRRPIRNGQTPRS